MPLGLIILPSAPAQAVLPEYMQKQLDKITSLEDCEQVLAWMQIRCQGKENTTNCLEMKAQLGQRVQHFQDVVNYTHQLKQYNAKAEANLRNIFTAARGLRTRPKGETTTRATPMPKKIGAKKLAEAQRLAEAQKLAEAQRLASVQSHACLHSSATSVLSNQGSGLGSSLEAARVAFLQTQALQGPSRQTPADSKVEPRLHNGLPIKRLEDETIGSGSYKTVFKRTYEYVNGQSDTEALYIFEPSRLLTPRETESSEDFWHRMRVAQRFEHEVQMLQADQEDKIPHTLRLLEVGVSEHRKWTVVHTEYIPGGNISQFMKKSGKALSAREVLNLAVQLCDYLVATHKKGRVHRDIKPDNILVDDTTTPYQYHITDLGFAYQKDEAFIHAQAYSPYAGTRRYSFPLQELLHELNQAKVHHSSISSLKNSLPAKLNNDFYFSLHTDLDWYGNKLTLLSAILGPDISYVLDNAVAWQEAMSISPWSESDFIKIEGVLRKENLDLIKGAVKKVFAELEQVNHSLPANAPKIDSLSLSKSLENLLMCPKDPYRLNQCDTVQPKACEGLARALSSSP